MQASDRAVGPNRQPLGILVCSGLLMSAAVSCTLFDRTAAVDRQASGRLNTAPAPVAAARPVVQVMPPRIESLPLLDPDADPSTPLGELRARYLPVWTRELDWAFPPETCGSAWEFDAIAVPDVGADVVAAGDPPTAAALAVVRYERLVAAARFEPLPLAQLCVAVATLDPLRTELLSELAAQMSQGNGARSGRAIPDRVTIVAAAPGHALVTSCNAIEDAPHDASAGDITTAAGTDALDRLRAVYLLSVARGIEDAVPDVSWRVSEVHYERVDACDTESYLRESWSEYAASGSAAGAAWQPVDFTVDVEIACGLSGQHGLCESVPR